MDFGYWIIVPGLISTIKIWWSRNIVYKYILRPAAKSLFTLTRKEITKRNPLIVNRV